MARGLISTGSHDDLYAATGGHANMGDESGDPPAGGGDGVGPELPGMNGTTMGPHPVSPITKAAQAGGMQGKPVPSEPISRERPVIDGKEYPSEFERGMRDDSGPNGPQDAQERAQMRANQASGSVLNPTPVSTIKADAPRPGEGRYTPGPGAAASFAGATPESDYVTDSKPDSPKDWYGNGTPKPLSAPDDDAGRAALGRLADETEAYNKSPEVQRNQATFHTGDPDAAAASIAAARETSKSSKGVRR